MPDAAELSRARGLIEDARSAFRQGDNDGATRAAREALTIARSACDDRLTSTALTWLGRVAIAILAMLKGSIDASGLR